MVPPGSNQDRGMCEKKRTDDRPAEGGALNSGRLVIPPFEPIYLQRANVFQRKEGCATDHQDSDPLIVVGDGNTVHMAKERAERQRGQSTHAPGQSSPGTSVSSSLSALRTKAEKAPKHRFRDLFGLIDQQRLCEAFHQLKKRAAPGIDGVTHAEYGENLTENLRDLETRLREGRYRAQHVRRQWIAKAGSTKMRPLGIPVLEDKIVQQAVRMILEPIWEADFCDESIGYRPGRQARRSTLDLGVALDSGVYRWVVEADIKGFFDHIDHDWLCRMLEERIDDPRLIRLIRKWLKAGVLEDGRVKRSEEGTPQGGVISPLLANIYLHFVQDLWIRKVTVKESRGRVLFRRYADDSIVCFERKEDAECYLSKLPGRLAKFKLELAEGKTALTKFNRWEPETSGKFTFLGFDFYWKGTRKNPLHRIVRRRTTAKKFRASLRGMKEWLKAARSLPLQAIVTTLHRKLQGYWNYYGVIGNSERLTHYGHEVKGLVFKWLNRRSQRKSYTWTAFTDAWARWKLPPPVITETPPPRSARQRAAQHA
jgi:RNA-directed DNA polymerase